MLLFFCLWVSLPVMAQDSPQEEEQPADPRPENPLPPEEEAGQPQDPVPENPRPPQGQDHPVPVGPKPLKFPPLDPQGRPLHSPPLHPVGEVRINWDLSRVDNFSGEGRGEAFSHRFTVPRAELGLVARISDRVQTRTVLHATEDHRTVDVDGAIGGEHQVPRHASGWAFQAQDVYATIQPLDTEDFWIQPGVQMTIFGSRNYFDEARGAYYLVGPRTEELAELAGVVHGRDLGVRVHGDVAEIVGLDAMVSNGNGHTGIGEDNLAKDLALRVDVAATEYLHVVTSAQRAVDGPDGGRAHLAWSLMTEWRGDPFRAMVEAIGGTEGHGGSDARKFMGGQGGLALERGRGVGPLTSQVVTARIGYFDPRLPTLDADAWLTTDLSLQGWWRARAPMGMMTGLGYNLWMPLDVAEPVGHAISFQTLFQI